MNIHSLIVINDACSACDNIYRIMVLTFSVHGFLLFLFGICTKSDFRESLIFNNKIKTKLLKKKQIIHLDNLLTGPVCMGKYTYLNVSLNYRKISHFFFSKRFWRSSRFGKVNNYSFFIILLSLTAKNITDGRERF